MPNLAGIAAAALVTVAPQQKAALLVVTTERPGVFTGAAHIRFADQEGGLVKAVPGVAARHRERPRAAQRPCRRQGGLGRVVARSGDACVVHGVEMVATAHFVRDRDGPFDAPLRVEPPK